MKLTGYPDIYADSESATKSSVDDDFTHNRRKLPIQTTVSKHSHSKHAIQPMRRDMIPRLGGRPRELQYRGDEHWGKGRSR